MEQLRVATWNVWGRFGPWEDRQPGIASTLAQVGADVVCLQEVWEFEDGGPLHERWGSQPQRLAEHLGLADHRYAYRFAWDGARFGNAILSRWPILRDEVRPLPPGDDGDELRTVLAVEIDSPAGALHVFTTHLNYKLSHSHVRQRQVRAVCDLVEGWGRGPVVPILTGDLNADPSADEIRMLTGRATVPSPGLVFLDAWELGGDGSDGRTWHRDNPHTAGSHEPDRRLDYVLTGVPRGEQTGRPAHAETFGTEAVDGLFPSDHFGVVAEIRLGG